MRILKQGVAQGPYLLGKHFTAAGVVIGSGIGWSLLFNLLPELPEFVSYANRLGERPGLQRQIAMEEELAQKSARSSADIPLACLIVYVIVTAATHITALV